MTLRFFRYVIPLLCFHALPEVSHSQYWMQKAGGLTVDEGYDIAVDGNGNTYTTGYFTGTASFGGTNLNSNGSTDIFVVKTNDQGVFQWAVKAGGSGADRGLSIAVDAQGNCYVTGYYNGTANFSGQTVTSAGLQDVFIAKYNSSGTLQWVSSAGGLSSDIGNGICVDNSGNVIVTGEFKDSASFGLSTITSMSGSTDVFTTKLSSAGAFTWVEQGAGANTDRGIDVSCDGSGNIYITGQFSQTITFDQTHNNTMFNVVFVVKYNSSGVEQWFRLIGGASSNIATAIATDGNGNSYLTGDFTGNVTFYGSSNTTLSGTYTNRVFVAKYNASGTLQWAESASSESGLSSTCIAIDGSGNAYIGGHFECALDEFSDQYGEGTFNSVGYKDIFVAKYSNSGSWQYSRNIGSREDDFTFGVDVNSAGNIHFTGSFASSLAFPTSGNFLTGNLSNWTQSNCSGNSPYCGDANYGKFHRFTSAGNSDVVIANCFDPGREPYDYYMRSGTGCVRDIGDVCIDPGCPDTASSCNNVSVTAQPFICPNIGPALDYQWSNFQTNQSVLFNTSGYEWVDRISEDGCFTVRDSIYIDVIQGPVPTITDDKGVNFNAPGPQPIDLCAPDTVLLTGGGFGVNDSIVWTSNQAPPTNDTSIVVTTSGYYNFKIIDENGCANQTTIAVNIFGPLDPIGLKFHLPDTVEICEEEYIGNSWVYDSISNPAGNLVCFDTLFDANLLSYFNVAPVGGLFSSYCQTGLFIEALDTGYYVVSATIIRYTPCDSDTQTVVDSMYVSPFPKPEIPPFTVTLSGSNFICPGDSTILGAGGAGSYNYNGPGFTVLATDTISVWAEGEVSASHTVYDTNIYGCTAQKTATATKCMIIKPQPELSAGSTLLCPSDSVLLTATHTLPSPPPCFPLPAIPMTGYSWEGPNGPIPGNGNSIYATDPGQYYCIFNDGDSCGLISNTVTINQYTTPSLAASGDLVICEGDSVTISVIANEGSQIEWLPPLSGSGLEKTVYSPGVYTCKITACNIETFATIEVFPSEVEAEITPSGVLCIGESITLYGSPGMASYSWWPTSETTDSIVISSPGNYVLTTMDSSGCTVVSDTVNIPMDQVPTGIDIDGYPVFCEGDSKQLFGTSNLMSYLWIPGGETTPGITVTEPGTYTLATVDTNGCKDTSEAVTLTNPPTFAPVDIIGPTSFCEGEYVTLISTRTKGLASYVWTPTNDSTRSITIFDPGTYSLATIDTFGCVAYSDSVEVTVQPHVVLTPQVSDTVICEGESLRLEATSNVGDIQWYLPNDTTLLHSGETFETGPLTENTTYYVWSKHFLCNSALANVLIEVKDCDEIFIPNVFTPNGDGENDLFRTRLNEAQCFSCYIYNRWGMLVYSYFNQEMGWDGTVAVSGEEANEGVYFYLVEYCRHDGEVIEHRGSVTLLRD